MDIITRKEAKIKGLKRFFTGEPCAIDYLMKSKCEQLLKSQIATMVF